MDSWLSFLSILIWQAIVIGAIILFRSEVRLLLERVARLKHGDTEVIFQEPRSEALEPSPVVAEALKLRDDKGFFTQHGIGELVQKSKYLNKDEYLKDSILVFRTLQQHTWLVATTHQVFFILDDEGTRSSRRLIQHRLPLKSALPVGTKPDSADTGVFQLGKSDWWYYSFNLLGKPVKADQRLNVFVRTAMD